MAAVGDEDIYLVTEAEELLPMSAEPYDSEDLLQELLEHYPQLMGGGRGRGEWLLVNREVAVPDRLDGTGRWSLDHLFVDASARPTLVEVKRATDTRIRREVVGQLLDYAANGVEYWPQGEMRRILEARLGGVAEASDAVQRISGMDPDAFWAAAEQNLRSGAVRLVIVADRIPRELQRIVEFLNERMPDTEVLAMEVRQYVGSGRRTLVPRIMGQTTRAQRAKATSPDLGYEQLLAGALPETRELHDLLASWVTARGGSLRVSPQSMGFELPDRHLVRIYPKSDDLLIVIERLREVGRGDVAERMHQTLQAWSPKRLSSAHVYLQTPVVVSHWPEFDALLDRYATELDAARA